MITQYTSVLIPDSVVDGKFPRADEDRLTGLATQWSGVEAEMTSEAASLTTQSRTVFANWSGGSADLAYAQITAVTTFASSVSSAAATMGAGCRKASSFVANTKAGINAVLVRLDNLTKEQILVGLSNPLLVPLCVQRILDLRTRARAIISAYSEALVSALSGIQFTVTVETRPSSSVSATAAVSSGGNVPVDASSTANVQPATYSSSGGVGTAPTVATSPSTAPNGSTTPTVTATLAGWTGGLAALQTIDVAAVITKAPQSPDTTPSDTPTTGTDPSTVTSVSTEPRPGATTGPSSAGTPSQVPTGGAGLLNDRGALYTQMGLTPPQAPALDPTASAAAPGSVHPSLMQSITNQVAGTGSGHDLARALDRTAPWSAPGAGPSPQPAPGAVNAGAPPAPASTGGGHQNWGGQHVGTTGSTPPLAPPAATSPAPLGTVAAGSAAPAATPIQNVAPAPVAPVMPVTSTTTVFGGSPGGLGSPSIQIAPGTAMPTTGLAGAPSGTSPFPTTTNVPPASTIAAPAAAVPSSAVPPTSVPPTSAPAANPATGPAAPGARHEQAGPPTNAAQPLRIEAGRVPAPDAPTVGGGVVTVATAIAALGLVGAAAQHFTNLWHDLGSTTLLRPAGTLLPTQFGRDDELLAAMPVGMETVYQKVLLPGEADQLLSGSAETLRGLVYPYAAVRELRTPVDLYDALGLGFVVSGVAGSDTLAFNRDAESVEVLRCAGLRLDDLVTPVDTDVTLPDGAVPVPLVRHHRRPWTGTGEAPGSTSENVIEEHEILGYASVAVPHLAEIWRLYDDGGEEHVSTYNARNGQWVGDSSPRQALVGRRIDNGAYAVLGDGTVFRTVVLTDRESVLVAYGVSAPEHFEQAHDGSYRSTVSNTDIVAVTGVATVGTWRGLPIQLLHRQGTAILVDYAGDDPAAAGAAGFLQLNQGQWQPRWVQHTEVAQIQELERHYPAPRAAVWQAGPGQPSPAHGQDDHMVDEASLGVVG